ncbi:15-hydroxyprostaglandin dehydrogenase [NAD(+)]-like isoform X1 [Saccostrea echinata]|uniref:15-hydroxyprostaglandin dehydrogenase [NAD(+)]-like isoform X1 n=1 Tax=Saccostrea echinata TaxID=191078 RepID=UPI002A8224ED|nr:15-hydroxyprostaglandin dehydrogenase [NAD(+)]-like isoform X1 [Saccostrea echinata]
MIFPFLEKFKMFRGKVAIITGSAQGLGKAYAKSLLERESKVCICDVNKAVLEKTYTEFKSEYGENVIFQTCDVTRTQQLEELFKKTRDAFGKIDIVVNNAGIVDEKDWEKCIDVNLNGVIRGTLLGLEYLRKDKGGNGGVIVNIASLAGVYPVNYGPAYAASKHGVIGYTRSWATHPEVINNGVRLVCLCPAFVDTDMLNVEEEKVVGSELSQDFIKILDIMSIEEVIPVFVKAIAEEDNNGSVFSIRKTGAEILSFPEIK